MGKTTSYPRVGPVSAHRDELSYVEFATDSPQQIDRRILESLPWRKANDFLASVGTERTLDGFGARVMREIGVLVPSDCGCFTVGDPHSLGRPQLFIPFRVPPGATSEYFGHYITTDPFLSSYPSTPRGVIPWTVLDCEFTRDYLRRYGIRHTILLGDLKDADGLGFILSFHRVTRKGFDEQERAAFFTLRPHLHNLFFLLHAPEKVRLNRLSAAARASGLTQREGEVLRLLCDRLSAVEIAENLTISRRTVEKHIEHVYLKLGVHGRKGLHEETVLGDALETAMDDRTT